MELKPFSEEDYYGILYCTWMAIVIAKRGWCWWQKLIYKEEWAEIVRAEMAIKNKVKEISIRLHGYPTN